MTLLPNEVQIATSYDNLIVLTNKRIQKVYKNWESSYSIAMYLEDISSIENSSKSNTSLLILGIAFILGGIIGYNQQYMADQNIFMMLAVAGIVLIALWLFSREHNIKICSKGGSSISILLTNNKKELVDTFIDQVLWAKGHRIMEINKLY